jgi:hypothetical protein
MGIIDTATSPIRQGAGQALKLGGWAVTQLRGGSGQQEADQEAEQDQPQGKQGGQRQQPAQRQSRQASRKPKDLDDATIARKVESAIYAVPGVVKGKIDVNVVDGKAQLRGTAKNPTIITGIVAAAEAVPEVKAVESLLHEPKTPARKPKPKRNQMPRTEPRRLNADKTVQQRESLPEEIAKEGKGRQPAPMGSEGGSEKSTAPTPADKGRFGRDAGEDGGTPKRATSGVATKNGPPAGGGEVV